MRGKRDKRKKFLTNLEQEKKEKRPGEQQGAASSSHQQIWSLWTLNSHKEIYKGERRQTMTKLNFVDV